MKQVRIQLAHHTVQTFPPDRLVVTTLRDGAEVHAMPHDTDEYRTRAAASGAANVDDSCLQHELCHVWWGEATLRESPVLAHVARGTPLSEEESWREEEIVLFLQGYFNRFGWPAVMAAAA